MTEPYASPASTGLWLRLTDCCVFLGWKFLNKVNDVRKSTLQMDVWNQK